MPSPPPPTPATAPPQPSADPDGEPAPGAEPASGPPPFTPRGRRTRVRARLLLAVALSSLAVLAAGAPAVYDAARDLSRAQELVDGAELGRQSLSLAHILADERDALTVAAATGTAAARDAALDDADLARADRRAARLRPLVPAPVRTLLDTLPAAREAATTGGATALETYHAYTEVIEALDGVTRAVSRSRPDRAAGPLSDALPDLARAVDASAATRSLLVAALSAEGAADGDGPGDGDGGAEAGGAEEAAELVALAQRTHAREAAALADFAETAGPEGRDSYGRTVTGPPVAEAEAHLTLLTAQPYLTDAGRGIGPGDLAADLAARTELQRGVLASLAADRARALRQLRQDDLNALQLHVALVAAAWLVALGIGVYTARSITHPLAVLRRGTRRLADAPATEPPMRYTGRNDEFAAVVAGVNDLHAAAVELDRRRAEASGDGARLRAERDRLRDGPAGPARPEPAAAGVAEVPAAPLAHHALRMRTLAGEQLAVVETLEEHETDADRLATFFALDHLAVRVRRHSESLLLLAGVDAPDGPKGPVPLTELALGAISEAARYELVDVGRPLPDVGVIQPAARDLGHLLAELLDNATACSAGPAGPAGPATLRVRLAGTLHDGDLLLRVVDDGPGVPPDRLTELNARLDPAAPRPADPADGMGLHTVARLAARHRLTVRLLDRPEGGLAAEVTVPAELLRPAVAYVPVPGVPAASAAAPPVPEAGGSPVPAAPGEFPADAAGYPAAAEAPPSPSPVPSPSPSDAVGAEAGAGAAGTPGPPAEHGHAAEQEAAAVRPAAEPPAATTTERGLPLRSRAPERTDAGAQAPESAAPAPAAAIDAELLRRRLGGFQRGARAGHRDAQAAGPPAEEEMSS